MTPGQAQTIVASALEPLPFADFRAAVSASTPLAVPAGPSDCRAQLFGANPAATLLAGYASHAGKLDCHSPNPEGPPPSPRACTGPDDFAALVAAYHAANYTIRAPDVAVLSPPLLRLSRALEILLHTRASVSLFWSRAGAGAKIHYDHNDIITVQLAGAKRWFVSTDPSGLTNTWNGVGEPPTQLPRYRTIDTGPGDLLYIPRGTPHTVEGASESLHLSILFTPLTVRAALIAALDELSDADRPLRQTLPLGDPAGPLDAGVARLASTLAVPHFATRALDRARGRAIASLERHVAVSEIAALHPASRLMHAELGAMHVSPSGHGTLDVAVPGGHIAIHPGARQALDFMAVTPAFSVADIPGLEPAVSAALAVRLIAAGVLCDHSLT